MPQQTTATHVFCGHEIGRHDHATIAFDDGVITGISSAADTNQTGRTFILPALVNAHDHARPTASSFGAVDMPLESWILRSVVGTPPDPYLAAASALARSARSGCAAMMIHYTRPSGTMPILDEAKAIARAAADVGMRMAFALSVRDQNPIVYGESEPVLAGLTENERTAIEDLFVHPAPTAKEYIATVEDIAASIQSPLIDVQFGPAGVQWCSRGLLEAIAERSALTGRRVHMHLLETIYQRGWADRAFPDGVVKYLRDIGLLSERLTLAHCIHARPDELDIIAASGARIVTNFSSNLHLRSGLAPIADASRRGCPIAVGVDGLALDEDDDALRELRLVKLAHGGVGYQSNWTCEEFLSSAVRNGRLTTGAPGGGELVPGAPADFMVIDLDRLERDAIVPVDPLQLLFARGNASVIRDVVVDGRTVVRGGEPTGVDLPAIETELRAMYRAGVKNYAAFTAAWPRLEHPLKRWFSEQCGCG
ncbi:amidohydrolase family protein [Bradyrhizobium sp. LHD-71]|uniref:amidohydrolase family protein n=1 Tax=Bradyrhizobium sp. LHD-71 TaxID=3072141 RepID=UPI00280EA30E|nr:amidohydrolase family protein [Bradyrhizobium sp. LHD-71]MDQ8730476.1 amidohydrolase family protein [Bradyrhizobium sp. LHD-71]